MHRVLREEDNLSVREISVTTTEGALGGRAVLAAAALPAGPRRTRVSDPVGSPSGGCLLLTLLGNTREIDPSPTLSDTCYRHRKASYGVDGLSQAPGRLMKMTDVFGEVADIGWAVGQLEQFIAMSRPIGRSRTGQVLPGGGGTPDDLQGQRLVIERILNQVTPGWSGPHAVLGSDPWAFEREACLRALVALRRGEEIRRGLGESAPRLSASSLHPWVWAGAKSLWGSGHYAEAVGAAARQVNAETQTKVSRRDVSETVLLQQCFSDDAPAPGKPRLRLVGDDGGKSASSLRRGVRAYAEGCYAALRNPAAHDVAAELSEHEALEQLAAFSILARWVDTASVETTS